jgi:hypothetical protein
MGRFGGERFPERRPEPVSFEKEPQPWNPEVLVIPSTFVSRAEKRSGNYTTSLEQFISSLNIDVLITLKERLSGQIERIKEDPRIKQIENERLLFVEKQKSEEKLTEEESHKAEIKWTIAALLEGGFIEYSHDARDVGNVALRFKDQPQENN